MQSGEMTTRLLYYKDAIDMIKNNPFGYGYMGWYYKQTEIQTGIYDAKYVHCSLLQIMLDVGIVPMICLSIFAVLTFFDKKQNVISRLIMILILGHSMIDIDFEYIYFILLFIIMSKFNTKTILSKKVFNVVTGALLCSFFIVAIAALAYEIKDYKTAYSILPFYTDALQEELYTVTSPSEQLKIANMAYKYNKNISGIYEAFSNKLVNEKKYDEAIYYQKKRLLLNKYVVRNYLEYLSFLSEGFSYYVQKNDEKNIQMFAQAVLEIEDIIDKTSANTNPLSYKTKHVPNFDLPEDAKMYIERMKEVAEKQNTM